ncbi:histidine phosphatase family protein [Bacillus marinisedimentorum]|uniref:histidine phosphatase family protein n=1 Tax=Bacillus marinisedimentorum TaxID=1821260 RepID=UPI001B80D2E3|nr:histidine phosphatase family protein [Bacillus marinisedimentorum]
MRHGETDWNKERRLQGQEDIPLNETGREQALRTAQLLSEGKWDAVLASPLSRARETAEIIRTRLNIVDYGVVSHFQERDFGSISGELFADVEELYKAETAPGMERLEDMMVRLEAGLAEVKKNFAGKRVIVVSHGVAIRVLLSHLFKEEVHPEVKLHNACVSHLSFNDGRWVLGEWNIADHLSDTTMRT